MEKNDLQLLVPGWPYACNGLAEVARERARLSPDATAFTFADYAGEVAQDQVLSCRALDRRARQIAALLQTKAGVGARVLLLYPSGLDYVCAFFGCLYAGMIAVPAYPPLNPRLRARLAAIAADCGAAVALTGAATLHELGDRSAMLAPLARLQWLATDTGLDGLEMAMRPTAIERSQIAFLQYTSGSSGVPKGVMVSNGNLLHNLGAIAAQMQFTADDHLFSWLPPYHDMGLIGALLSPFAAGMQMTFMAPLAFLRRPARWLREVSARGCTISGAPNFAYELCMSKMAEDDDIPLSLERWTVAFNGAEPIKANTMERFARRFAAHGFAREAFYPCYGMAETTLMVTGKRRAEPFQACPIDREAYAHARRVVPAAAGSEAAQAIVSCGAPASGMTVVVVDPVSLAPLPECEVGEILVSGASVAHGYWNRELETLAAFGIEIAGHAGRFLRTGDLGFLRGGELHVSGRLKDMIIIRGVNHYPQDIESTVDQCHEAVRSGCGICFSIEHDYEERLVVVQEIARRDKARADQITQAIRAAIQQRHDIVPHAVVLVENGSIHKTTSGKLSRRPCRQDYLNNALPVVAQWSAAATAGDALAAAV